MAAFMCCRNRRKEAGKRFSPQGFKDARRGEKDRQRNGGKAPFLKKFRFSVHDQVKIQSGIAGAGKAWPSTSFARRFLWRK
jgi:hypothetical protein